MSLARFPPLQNFGFGLGVNGVAIVPLGFGEVLLLHLRAVPGVLVHLVGVAAIAPECDALTGLEKHDHLDRAFAGITRGAGLEDRTTGAVLQNGYTAAESTRAPDEEETAIRFVLARHHEDGALLPRLDDAELALRERRQSEVQIGGRRHRGHVLHR